MWRWRAGRAALVKPSLRWSFFDGQGEVGRHRWWDDLTSLPAAADRGRWGIEPTRHVVWDAALRKEARWVRAGHAAVTLAPRRRLAFNNLGRETRAKVGVKARRLLVG